MACNSCDGYWEGSENFDPAATALSANAFDWQNARKHHEYCKCFDMVDFVRECYASRINHGGADFASIDFQGTVGILLSYVVIDLKLEMPKGCTFRNLASCPVVTMEDWYPLLDDLRRMEYLKEMIPRWKKLLSQGLGRPDRMYIGKLGQDYRAWYNGGGEIEEFMKNLIALDVHES